MKNVGKKEIMFVVTSMGRGGAERVVSILANHYASIGWKTHIVMLWYDYLDYKLDDRITIHKLSQKGKNQYLKIPILVLTLRKLIREISPTAVVSFIAQNNVISGFAVKGLDVRFIPSERIDPSTVQRNTLLKKLIDYTYEHSTLTVLQTKRAYNYFSPAIQKNSVVIYNPIDVSCSACEKREKSIVTAGRLEPEKNQQLLIKAFSKFSKNHPDYRLIIYGEGRLRQSLTELVDSLGISSLVDLPGNVSDIQEREAQAGMFVLSSDREGMSNALMEAMAIGLPCISTACSGSDELIEDGVNGILIPLRDENALVAAMNYYADNPEKANNIANESRQYSARFSVQSVIQKWESAIEGDEKI